MRFSIAATAFMASVASAGSIVYMTEEVTITSCAPTVTNCPASSTVTSTKTYPVITTSTSAPATYPTGYANVSSPAVPTYPAHTESAPVSVKVPVYSTSSAVGVPSSSPVVSTMTISTCVPTVIYSVVTVTPTAPVVTKPVHTYVPAPSGTGVISYPHNATYPTATGTPPPTFTGAASTVQGSMAMAAVAGVAAFIFA